MNAIVTATQPAGTSMVSYHGETASAAAAAQAKALVEARFVMALRNPRDIDVVRERMLKECRRPSFAKVARYHKPVGAGIKGPSIRFAEMAIRCMSNISIDTPTTFDDREKRIMRVTASDIESNVSYSADITIDKTVERKKPKPGDAVIRTRLNSYGETVSLIEATEDEILNKQNALVSKAVRTLGLRLVPGDIVDECQDLIVATLRNEDARDPDAAKRAMFDAFAGIGIGADQMKEYLGHEAKVLSPTELDELRGLYAAIRDGEANWASAIEHKRGRPSGGGNFNVGSKSKPEPKAEPAQSANPGATIVDGVIVDKATGEVLPEAAQDAQQGAQAEPATDAKPTTGSSAPAAANPNSVYPWPWPPEGHDMPPGQAKMLGARIRDAKLTPEQVEAGIGAPLSKASANDALQWIARQGA